MVEVLLAEIFAVDDVLVEFVCAASTFKTFLICNFICSFFIRDASSLNKTFQLSRLLSTSFFSGVLFQLNDDRLMLVAHPHSTRMMAEMLLTPIHSHIFVAAVAGSRLTAVTWGFSGIYR